MICPCIPSAILVNDILSVTIRMQQIAANAEASRSILRLIDYFTIPKHNGNSVVLLLSHPGINTLGRYFSPSQVNDLLLTKQTPAPLSDSHNKTPPLPSDLYNMPIRPEDEDQGLPEDLGVMNLTTFMESVSIAIIALPISNAYSARFAIQATHCLDMIHRLVFLKPTGESELNFKFQGLV